MTPSEPAAERSESFDTPQIRQLLVYLAAAHMAAGATAHEAAADVDRAARALGIRGVQVQANPGGVTLSLGSGSPATFETVEGSLRLDQTARVASVQHGLETGSLSPDQALARLRALRAQPPRFPIAGMYFGHLLVAIGIAGILQPTWASIAFAAVLSPVTVALIRVTGRGLLPSALLPLFAAFITSAAAFWAYQHGLIKAPIRTMLPPLAVLLPGALLVTGLSELVSAAMVSGTSRLAYGTTQLVMFTAGVAGATRLTDVGPGALSNTHLDHLGPLAGFLGLVLVTAGIGLMESVPRKLGPWVFAVTALTFVTEWSFQRTVHAPWVGPFAGALVASFTAWSISAFRPQLPRLVLFLPSFWLLVPGSLGLVSLAQLHINPRESWQVAMTATSVIIAIALGLAFGTTAVKGLNRLRWSRQFRDG